MRAFLALDLSDLECDLKKLRVNLNKAKNLEHQWIPRHHWHVPLLPLGEIGAERFQSLMTRISSIVNLYHCFDLKLEGVWAYPDQSQARILWIGVQNSKDLRELHAQTSRALGTEVEETPTPFKPHLPVVRLRNYREVSDLISPFKNAKFGKVTIRRVIAYEMTSGGAFPTYRRVEELFLPDPREHPLSV